MIEYENLAQSNRAFIAELEQAAGKVLSSGWYVLGQEVTAFEQEFAAWIGAEHCIGVANGLDALTLSIEVFDLPANSDILVASNTYIATILAIIRTGHRPILVEPELDSFNIDPNRLISAMSKNTRAICVTHLFGKPCRMDVIADFANTHDLRLVEDCAQSHGAKLQDKATGTFGDAGCFSFYPTKNLGAFGDGGAIVTNDTALAERLRYLRNYGFSQKYVHDYAGINSRLDELQAALLRVKLRYLHEITAHKRRLAKRYFDLLPAWLTVPRIRADEWDVFHIFAVRHPRRDKLRAWLLENGVKTEVHYPIPPHRQKSMQGILKGEYLIADELHATELSLPISFAHTETNVIKVCEVINAFAANSGEVV